jgi:short-subunit dehydrogenase
MKRAVITGASTGIGRSLAILLARRGYAVALLARRPELLESLAVEIRSAGGQAAAVACDVSDRTAVKRAVLESEKQLGGSFDLAIANAGVSIPGHASKFNLDDAEQVIKVNLLGTMYLFDAVIPSMVAQGSGQFVGIASIAGLRGLPTAAAYSASKAAMQTFLEASRNELAGHGVGVITVNPGFIETPMTEKNRFKMPFLMKVDDAAAIIADGIEARNRVIEFPLPMSIVMRILRFVPDPLFDRMVAPYARRRLDPTKVKR